MENNIHVKLECSITDPRALCSLMELMIEKMKMIQSLTSSIQRMELNLFDDKNANTQEPDKVAMFRLVSNEGHITESSRSARWDDAVLNTIDKIRERVSKLSPWEIAK
ncbi:hypothetical protein [Flavihumibacter sp.]|uniref:hypothetical protein n=1 Tax=Flavihumibacter sp. TaxID=1913981 RepID=UPI002FC8C1EC|nr:hypothetical protein [Flavihumibacter sediminis]